MGAKKRDAESQKDAKPAAPLAAGKLKSKEYERALADLQVELVKLQMWVVEKGLKVCVVFEGRDGAGKGGVIKAISERVSPRVFRVVALPAPTEREKSQCTCNATCGTFRRRAKSSCSTAAGTIAPASRR
jgi:polyphosphate kinase